MINPGSLTVGRSALALVGLVGLLASTVLLGAHHEAGNEVLPSWRDTGTRERIIDFVQRVTDADGPAYVPPAARIAVFDNDGTLWAEKPAYFQLFFAIDLAREQIENDPQLAERSPWLEIAAGDLAAIAASGEAGLLELMMATHAGVSETEFRGRVLDWLAKARHPQRDVPYTALVYQPMLELLDYLRAHDFTPWIVSGGGQSFLRAWAEEVYGIPPQHVIGSQLGLEYRAGTEPSLERTAEVTHINDKGGKPVGIQRAIGRRPILAVGNSDGDFAMLEWTTSIEGPSLGVLIHHTDGERAWAYDRDSSVGRLDRGLDYAPNAGWIVVDMKLDWELVFPPTD
jgi:phosphoserine phosphatase